MLDEVRRKTLGENPYVVRSQHSSARYVPKQLYNCFNSTSDMLLSL